MKKTFNLKNVLIAFSILVLMIVSVIGINAGKDLKPANAYRMPGNSEVAREIGQEGIVLLKNTNNCLPFTSSMAIGGLGTGQDNNFQFGGGGSGWVHAGDENRVNPATAFEAAAASGRIKSYTRMGSASGSFDRVIYFITRYSTEGRDIYQADYYLNNVEKNDITNLCNLVGKENVVIMLNIPSVIDTTWLIEKGVGAIMVVWMGGEQAGNSIADVCTGVVSPSGKLADTWAKDLQYYPTTKNSWWDSVSDLTTLQNNKNDFGEFGSVKYEEDIYLGYRYFETFDPTYQLVNYEFGFGLSYTTFNIEVTGVNVNKSNDKIKVFVNVTNTGSFAGKEVVQVYYSTPNDAIDSPAKQLIAFAKTQLLEPNGSQMLTLEFNISEMSQFDDLGVIQLDAFVMQRGDYNIYVGNSIKDSGRRLAATYTQTANEVIEQCSHLTSTLDKRLTSDGTYENYNVDKYSIGYGMTLVQAEDYHSSSHYSESTNDWNVDEIVGRHEIGFSSGLHLRQAQQKTFRYRLYVDKIGTYKIDFSMSNARGNTISNCLNLFVDYTDDATDNGTNQNVTVNCIDTGDWFTNWTLIRGNTITFNKTGEVYLTMVTGSDCANIDYFVIYNNNVSATKVTQISGPAFTSAVNTENSDQAPTPEASINGTCLGFLHSGRQVKYTLNVVQAGEYYLDFDASSCGYASNAVATVSINGVAQSTKVQMMRTACSPEDEGVPVDHFFYFSKTNQFKVTLPEGAVELTIDFHNSAITNLRSINFTPISLGARSYTYTDNTDYWNLQSTFRSDGVGLDLGYKYIDVVQGNCTVEAFLNQMHSSELAYMTGLYTGTDVTGDGVNEPRLEDVNSGVGGFGGVLGTALVDYYGIPYAATADGPAGIRFIRENDTSISEFYRRSTYFPCITMLSSTWNVDLAYKFGQAYGAEAQAVGIEVMLAPGMNIHRSPLGGRNFEYISEDPFVTGSFATAITLGCQSKGVSVSVKHFAANSQENNRFQQDTKVSARALREIYLKGFEMVIKNANPGTMMSSYNYVNGVSTGEHYELITNVVRNEWKWEGVLESDWSENINDCTMVNAGNNLHSCVIHYDQIELGYKLRLIDKAKLVENASYIIKFLIRSQASSLSESVAPSIEAATKITCTDGSGRVWEPMEHTNIQIISPSKSVWEAGKASGIHGDARLETSDGTTLVSWTSANSGVYGAIAVEKAGDYYLSYTLNIGAIAEKYGKFNLYIDGVLADTFTNPNKLKSTIEWGTEDWISEDIFYGDEGSKKVTLTAGLHRIYIKILDDKFNFHNIIFSYGKPANQEINQKSGLIDVRNYVEKTGSVRVEGNHIASLIDSTITYKVTVAQEGTYGLYYLLNIPGNLGSYGNFTLSIDGNVVDAFTNPNKVTTGTDWVTFKWYTGDSGEKQVYLTEGEHEVVFASTVQEYNVQAINFRYVAPENYDSVAKDASVLAGASIWADKDGQTGKIKFTISTQDAVEVVALVVETSKINDRINLFNYSSYGAEKIDCIKEGNNFVAQFNVNKADFATSYTIVFIAQQTSGNLTVYNQVNSDSRSCKQVAQNLIANGVYTQGVLGYYIV